MNSLQRNDRWADTPVPPAIQDPPYVSAVGWFVAAQGTLIILHYAIKCIRTRRLTYYFLFLSNSLLCYWMETIGDWGQHLVYSPRFARHHLLDWLPLKSPNDPVFVPFAYACYWTAHSVLLMYFAPRLQRAWKSLTLLQAVIILSLPINYALDITLEGLCTYLGYWTYDPGFGPVIVWPGGGRQPLTWPILLMTGWPNIIAYWGGKPPLHSLNIIERWFCLDRWTVPKTPTLLNNNDNEEEGTERTPLISSNGTSKKSRFYAVTGFFDSRLQEEYDASLDYEVSIPRWRFELARFGAWFVTFQVSFFVTLVIPLVALRMVTGHDSIYVP